MTQFITIEPPDGDFVAYIDAIVGPPPEDPETAAKLISEQLALRSRGNLDIMNSISKSGSANPDAARSSVAERARAPLGTAWGHGVEPKAAVNPLQARLAAGHGGIGANAATDGLVKQVGVGKARPDPTAGAAVGGSYQGLRGLIRMGARLMVFSGIGWILASILLSQEFPDLSPLPGIALFFSGIVIGSMAESKRRRV